VSGGLTEYHARCFFEPVGRGFKSLRAHQLLVPKKTAPDVSPAAGNTRPRRNTRVLCFGVALMSALVVAGCGSATQPSPDETCSGFADWSTSAYVLPYAVGDSFRVLQGNCSPPGNGHRGTDRYGYDFAMPIGTAVHAARAGRVIQVEESHVDGQVAATGFDNYVVIQHPDGTAGLYGHLTHDGAQVQVGDEVGAGAIIGSSGNTGNTGGVPHLHFSAQQCDPVTGGSAGCPSLPVTFRNTDMNPAGLQVGQTYAALTF
jgi:hypothetical protein